MNYAMLWSEGNINDLMEIYSPEVELKDSLFGYTSTGTQVMKDYASSFWAKSHDANWDLLLPFSEDPAIYPTSLEHPFVSQGGVFGITVEDPDGNPCEIQLVVILTPNKEGMILSQTMFYSADTLFACGWAE